MTAKRTGGACLAAFGEKKVLGDSLHRGTVVGPRDACRQRDLLDDLEPLLRSDVQLVDDQFQDGEACMEPASGLLNALVELRELVFGSEILEVQTAFSLVASSPSGMRPAESRKRPGRDCARTAGCAWADPRLSAAAGGAVSTFSQTVGGRNRAARRRLTA